MNGQWLVIVNVLLVAALATYVIVRERNNRKLQAAPTVKDYPRQEVAIPNANRILEDTGQSLKDSDM